MNQGIRRVFYDTETTGISFREGHRVLEIAALETIDNVPTGRVFHRLINPDRDVPEDSTKVHGHTNESLAGQPRFREIMPDFLAFIEGAELVAHNSSFDEGHLNAELVRAGHAKTIWEYATFVDTLELSRRLHTKKKAEGGPGAHNLDTLLDYYNIDRSRRTKHGALIDSELLCDLYRAMGERFDLNQPDLEADVPRPPVQYLTQSIATPVVHANADELALHEKVLDGMEKYNQAPPVARQQAAAAPPVSRPRI